MIVKEDPPDVRSRQYLQAGRGAPAAPAPAAPSSAAAAPPPPPPPVADTRRGTNNLNATTVAAKSDTGPLPWHDSPAAETKPAAPAAPEVEPTVAVTLDAAAEGTKKVVEVTGGVDDRDANEVKKDEALGGGDTANEITAMKLQNAENQRTLSAVKDLSPEQQKQYADVKDAATKSGIPDADAAVEAMARTGQFERHPEVLKQLSRITTQEPDTKMAEAAPNAKNQLVGELVRQLANPATIKQDPKFNTCSEAALERQMATQDPAGYVKAVADLASKDTHAVAANGGAVSTSPYGLESYKDSGRSLASSLFQQGFHAAFSQGDMAGGIKLDDMRGLMNAQLPDHEVATFGQDQAGKALDALKPGAIAIIDTGNTTKHAVNIISNEGGQVTYQDPLGAKVTQSRADFEKNLVGGVVPMSAGIKSTDENWDIGGDTTMATTVTATPTTTTAPPPRRR